MPLQLRYVSHSEVGLVRKNNQDSGYASPRLLAVADGMGGAAAGDLASAVAIDAISHMDTTASGEAMLELLSGAFHRANDRIADLVEEDYNLEGMGTTLTSALFDGNVLGLGHIGDSRAYLLREGRLSRLTHDHSWVQSLVDEGRISEEEAATHPHRSLLIKVLNGHPSADPDLTLVKVQEGDRLLFCSDGVCGLVDDPAIAEALRKPDLATAMGDLVDAARQAGGIDNITLIVADVVADDGTSQPAVLGAALDHQPPPVAPEPTVEGEDTVIAERPAALAQHHEDEARYNPQLPHRHPVGRLLLALVLMSLILIAALGAAWGWTRTQYYVGAVDDQVAIFRGLSDPVPGLRLSRVYEVQDLTVSSLPPYYQAKVHDTIQVISLSAARETVNELAAAARRCAPQGGGSPSAAPSSAPAGSPTASASLSPLPTAQPTSAPSPSSPESGC